jgi:DNA-binding HxlR family transcriptional regulator
VPNSLLGQFTESPHTRGGFAVPRTATLPARRDSVWDDRRSLSKPAGGSIQALTPRPSEVPLRNGKAPRIQPSDEPVIRRAISLVQGKWKIGILCQLQDGPLRVGELKRRLSPISKKVLNQHLRKMQKEGLISRTELNGKIPHVEYTLTSPLGSCILHLLQLIAQWRSQASLQIRHLPSGRPPPKLKR